MQSAHCSNYSVSFPRKEVGWERRPWYILGESQAEPCKLRKRRARSELGKTCASQSQFCLASTSV